MLEKDQSRVKDPEGREHLFYKESTTKNILSRFSPLTELLTAQGACQISLTLVFQAEKIITSRHLKPPSVSISTEVKKQPENSNIRAQELNTTVVAKVLCENSS